MLTERQFDGILDCFKKELEIDKYSLEDECIRQPNLYAKYAELYAEAEREMALAKLERDKVLAELDKEIRTKHELYGFTKPPTETAIERWVKANARYIAAQSERIQAGYKMNVIDGIKWALQHRKSSLEHLVSLFLNNYYSDIPVKGTKEVRREEQDKRMDKQIETINQNERLLKRRITNGS
jgi:hypothetical protein